MLHSTSVINDNEKTQLLSSPAPWLAIPSIAVKRNKNLRPTSTPMSPESATSPRIFDSERGQITFFSQPSLLNERNLNLLDTKPKWKLQDESYNQLSTQRYAFFKYENENENEKDKAMSELFNSSLQESDLALGAAVGKGDCFFDAVAKALNEKSGKEEYTVKSLRLLCEEYVKSEHENNNWVRRAVEQDREDYNQYLTRLQFTAEEMEEHERNGSLSGTVIWGRPTIEGRIICEKLNIKLHVIEGRDAVAQVHPAYLHHHLTSAERIQDLGKGEGINYSDNSVIHIAVELLYFVPILEKQKLLHQQIVHY